MIVDWIIFCAAFLVPLGIFLWIEQRRQDEWSELRRRERMYDILGGHK